MIAEIIILAKNRAKESPGPNREAGCALLPLGGAAAVVLWTILLSSEITADYQICTTQRDDILTWSFIQTLRKQRTMRTGSNVTATLRA